MKRILIYSTFGSLCLAIFIFAWSPHVTRVPMHKSNPIAKSSAAVIPRMEYAYAVVRSGLYNAQEARLAIVTDPVVRTHYHDINIAALRPIASDGKPMYVSYRKNNQIYWTSKKVRVPQDETLLSDGTHFVRSRCGNRLSETPQQPTETKKPPFQTSEPTEGDLGQPRLASLANTVSVSPGSSGIVRASFTARSRDALTSPLSVSGSKTPFSGSQFVTRLSNYGDLNGEMNEPSVVEKVLGEMVDPESQEPMPIQFQDSHTPNASRAQPIRDIRQVQPFPPLPTQGEVNSYRPSMSNSEGFQTWEALSLNPLDELNTLPGVEKPPTVINVSKGNGSVGEIPEPSTLILLRVGLILLVGHRQLRRR